MLKTPGDRGSEKRTPPTSPAIFAQARAFRQPWQRSAAKRPRPGAMSLWVDGVSIASITTSLRPGGSLAGPGVAVTIGNCPNENRQTFDGLIDEVRISNGLALPAAPQPVQMPVNRSVESPKRSSSKPPHSIRLRNRLHIRRLGESR